MRRAFGWCRSKLHTYSLRGWSLSDGHFFPSCCGDRGSRNLNETASSRSHEFGIGGFRPRDAFGPVAAVTNCDRFNQS